MVLFLLATVWPPAMGVLQYLLFRRVAGLSPRAAARMAGFWWMVAAVPQLLIDAVSGNWLPSACAVVNAGIGAWLWWRNRRRRDRAPRTYGAKSRARVAALARKAKQAARPSPVLRPVLGGAR